MAAAMKGERMPLDSDPFPRDDIEMDMNGLHLSLAEASWRRAATLGHLAVIHLRLLQWHGIGSVPSDLIPRVGLLLRALGSQSSGRGEAATHGWSFGAGRIHIPHPLDLAQRLWTLMVTS